MRFEITCIQRDGSKFKKEILASRKSDALEEMREYKKVFIHCKDWKLTERSTSNEKHYQSS